MNATLAAAEAIDDAVAAGDILPLAGVVIAVKDNIDVAGMPTTAACPTFSYLPDVCSSAVQSLVDAGAIIIGKTNMDQFATGLVGTRSPHGAVRNAINEDWMSGGSSSGSAVAVALGIVDGALGTDTAGSGRVPAALNGVVGAKPTRGWVSTTGVVPACASLDCVSVMASTVQVAWQLLATIAAYDDLDPRSRSMPTDAPATFGARPRIGIAPMAALGLDDDFATHFASVVDTLRARPDVELVDIEPAALFAISDLLYGGSFVAERYSAFGAFAQDHPGDIDPSVLAVVEAARDIPAHRYTTDLDHLAALRRQVEHVTKDVDVILLPAAHTMFTIDEIAADPMRRNAEFGRLNNFANMLDMCAVTIPVGVTARGVPFGVNLFGRAFSDGAVATLAATLLDEQPLAVASASERVRLAVVGAHLTGQPLNHQLSSRGARLVSTTRTAATYRLHALPTTPPKPGLVRVTDGSGAAIEVEVWELTTKAFGSFVADIPAPLGIGTLELADGSTVAGFICEPYALVGTPDVTHFGGWRAYRASLPPR